MRFLAIHAHAFGPFHHQTLELAPGMNLVFGPNEAGKSSWHAALYAGLCGMRRAKGTARPEDRDFRERHRPWAGSEWTVGATIELADGRRIELRHDLDGKVDCSARDAVIAGRDYSAEIIGEGAPDGSRWLGLDRRSFLATACVRQAEVLSLARQDSKEAAALQEYLQRATTSLGGDATAAQAIAKVVAFQANQVGSSHVNAVKPLRRALDRVANAKRSLTEAQLNHGTYLDLLAQRASAEQRAAEAQRMRDLARAKLVAREATTWAEQLRRAQELTDQFPGGRPESGADDEQAAQAVSAALATWEGRPEIPNLTGASVAEMRRQLDQLPAEPIGDQTVDASVRDAWDTYRAAERDRVQHEAERPAVAAATAQTQASEQELRDLARELARPAPSVDAALVQRVEAAQRGVDHAPVGQRNRTFLVGGVLLLIVGIALAFVVPPGGLLAVVGVVLLVLGLRGGDGAPARLRAVEELQRATDALGAQRYALAEFEKTRAIALARVRALAVPEDPTALEQLAQDVAAAAEAQRDLARWTTRHADLEAALRGAESQLRAALHQRGASAEGAVDDAYAAYEASCQALGVLAVQARQRAPLEQQLRARAEAEEAAQNAAGRRAQAERDLQAAGARCSLPALPPDELAERLHGWLRERAASAHAQDEARQSWAELEQLLGGRSLEELAREAASRQQQAADAAAHVDPSALAAFTLEGSGDAQLARAEEELAQANEARTSVRTTVEERTRTLVSVPEAEEALAAAEAELARLNALDATLAQTRHFLEEAQEQVHRDIAPVLAAAVGHWLPAVTAGHYREAKVAPDTLAVEVRDTTGQWRDARLLSHGTAEQIYLLLRIAMAERLTRAGESCPLILDDVTAQSDDERTEAILRTLHTISSDRQVILFSQERAVLEWCEAHMASEAQDRIVRLEATAVTA